jgi:hypothetical protein
VPGLTSIQPFVKDVATVPAEIWDIIIDILKDDKQTLARCASVHRTWRPRALAHLFRVIQLNSPENARRFLDILCGDGSIAHMVRGVELWEFESTWVQSPPELWNPGSSVAGARSRATSTSQVSTRPSAICSPWWRRRRWSACISGRSTPSGAS